MGGNSQMMGGQALGSMFMNMPNQSRPMGNVPVATQPQAPQMPNLPAQAAPQAAPMPMAPQQAPQQNVSQWTHDWRMKNGMNDPTVDSYSNPMFAPALYNFTHPLQQAATQPTQSWQPSRNQLLAQAINNKYK